MNYFKNIVRLSFLFMVSTIACSLDFEHEFLQDVLHTIKKEEVALQKGEIQAKQYLTKESMDCGNGTYEPILVCQLEPKKIICREDAIEANVQEQKKYHSQFISGQKAQKSARMKEDFDAVFPYIAFVGIIQLWIKQW